MALPRDEVAKVRGDNVMEAPVGNVPNPFSEECLFHLSGSVPVGEVTDIVQNLQ